jgi:hypothetical protein
MARKLSATNTGHFPIWIENTVGSPSIEASVMLQEQITLEACTFAGQYYSGRW